MTGSGCRRPLRIDIRGPIGPEDLDGLCTRVCTLLADARDDVVCDVASVPADAVAVDALARLQLGARRAGCRVQLVNASAELSRLVGLMGLEDIVSTMSSREGDRLPWHPTTEEVVPMAGSNRMIFPNLAVQDLERSRAFFTELGFSFDPRFTDENGAAMVVNDGAVVMLLREEFFKTFTTKELADPTKQAGVIIALSAESREDADALADKALASGGSPANEPTEMDFMYGRSFHDPDGHQWEVFWMDMGAVEAAGSAVEAAAR
jgi:predicted lactoylglutathione lyase/ABC-type transporter Mla MlaB component